MRAYIRYPSDAHIELSPLQTSASKVERIQQNVVQDISVGGLSFCAPERLALGTKVKIKIPAVTPPFEAEAQVVWCVSKGDHFEAGVEFGCSEDAYAARMVEQICHIEHYRVWVKEVEGRDLDLDHAALEWISKYAKDFPSLQRSDIKSAS